MTSVPTLPTAVVMPTHNQVAYIGAAVESVFSQGIPGLRLVVQDGASTDGTPALLQQLSRLHPALEWRSEPDTGPAHALNRGFARALADPAVQVLGWLNSDDLYTPGAVARALAHFEAHPAHAIVYGEGEHVDAEGRPLGRYPTCAPGTPLAAWADGCPICQPTVFLRREAAERLLPLDTTLRTAFDFDAWFRLWPAFPDRIGQVAEVQAISRLHAASITRRQGERVALEAMQLIHRHIGPAPGHWLLVCAEELLARLPDGDLTPLSSRLARLLGQALPWMDASKAGDVQKRWRQHCGMQLARPDAVLDLQPDGWLGETTALRLRPARAGTLQLHGTHQGPQPGRIALRAEGPAGENHALEVTHRGRFVWRQPVAASPDATQHWTLHATPGFVPAQVEPGSTDTRMLVCRIDHLALGA